jgi:hypothetical protein
VSASQPQKLSLADQWRALGMQPPVAGKPNSETVTFVQEDPRRYALATEYRTAGAEPTTEDLERVIAGRSWCFQDVLDLWVPTGLAVRHRETTGEVTFEAMEIPGGRPQWDLGARFMIQAKSYADVTGKRLVVTNVT